MKRLSLIAILTVLVVGAGCASPSAPHRTMKTSASDAPGSASAVQRIPAGSLRIQDEAGSAVVQMVEFRIGVSSVTVERLAKGFGCNTRAGAALVTERGPVEVYRTRCENGTTFLAQCELRQCRPMR